MPEGWKQPPIGMATALEMAEEGWEWIQPRRRDTHVTALTMGRGRRRAKSEEVNGGEEASVPATPVGSSEHFLNLTQNQQGLGWHQGQSH